MELRLFGEVQLHVDEQSLDLGTPLQQTVLAVLAVDANRPVPIESLIDRVWGETPPTQARNVLYSHLSRIRQMLRHATGAGGTAARLDRRSSGYVLEIDPEVVDLHRFTHLVNRGTDRRLPAANRAALLAEALSLWRGPPLTGLSGEWVARVRDSWHRRRLDAAVRWAEAELELGRAAPVIEALPDLIAEYPLAEQFEGLLMRALHAAGRLAEAIDRYGTVRQRLADELGTDPGPELRALHAALLRGTPLPHRTDPGRLAAVPAQLPPDVFAFAGRDGQLRLLDSMVVSHPRAVRIVAVSGTAGVGKTALVVHWAHKVRGEFPGGQLYVNLRGFDPTGSPVAPAEALRGFLDAFEVPAQRIPASFEAQVGLYRSLLANRRVLIVLDNARDAEQVRPLLPGSPDCLVLVTSRNTLTGLIAAGAHPLTVDRLDIDEARALLSGRVGADRVAAEAVAVDEIVDLCARLPLALAVVAARAVTHPQFELGTLASELRRARGSLNEFADADPVTDPRAVFSWSYLQLSAPAARLFRLIGLHPGPDLGAPAAASLAGLPADQVRPLLTELARAHLVEERRPGRYGCHDLLRAYAAEQARALDSEGERHEATRRLLAHYIHSANHADRCLDPSREEPPALTRLPAGVVAEQPTEHTDAIAWFNAEHRVLLTAIHQDVEFDEQVWELVWNTRRFLAHQGHWQDEIDALTVALAAAQRLGDPVKQAFAHCYLGCTFVWFERYDKARAQLRTAAELYESAGDTVGQAYVQLYFSWMLDEQQRYVEALGHAERALALFRSAGHVAGQAKCLNAVGWFHALLGDYMSAIDHCEKALALQTELGDYIGAGQTWHSLGYSHDHLGRYAEAIACYQAAVDQFRESGYRFSEAYALASLGDTQHNAGDSEAAATTWRHALDIFDQLGHPDADKVRTKLARADS